MTVEEIKVKFDALGTGAFTQAQCDAMRDAIMNIENMNDVGDLMKLTVGS